MAEKISFAKLNNKNYLIWKYKVELLLIREGVWHVISETKPGADKLAAWTKSNDQARAWIGLCVEDDQLRHIRKESEASKMWLNLKNYHEKGTLSNKVQLMRKICSLRLVESGNMENHITEMTTLFEHLEAVSTEEDQLTDSWIVAMLLSSLPRSYDTLITALEIRPEQDLTVDMVQSKLIEEWRRHSGESSSSSEIAMVVQNKDGKNNGLKKLKCFFCKRNNHMKKDCRKYAAWKAKSNQEKANNVSEYFTRDFCFCVTATSNNDWLIDSGATSHMSHNKSHFVELNKNFRSAVTIANNKTVYSEGIGSIVVNVLNDKNEELTIRIERVLYVPDINANLLSGCQFYKICMLHQDTR